MRRSRARRRVAWRQLVLALLVLFSSGPLGIAQYEAVANLTARQLAARTPAATVANRLPGAVPALQTSPPSPSGAAQPYPLNDTFDAEATQPGSPAGNSGFETAPSTVGTPPTNHTFDTDLSNWISSGTTSWDSDGGNGFANLQGSGILTSSTIAVTSATQFLTVRLKGLSAGADQYRLHILSGAGFTTSTQVAFTEIVDSWTTIRVDLQSWQSQDIKLKVERFIGKVGLDDAGIQTIELANWSFAGTPERLTGGPNGAYVKTSVGLTTEAFTLDAAVQQLTVAMKGGGTVGTGFFVELLRGPTFSTVTQLAVQTANATSWEIRAYGVGPYVGETIKLRVRPNVATLLFDDVGIPVAIAPGWSTATADAVAAGTDPHGTYVTPTTTTGHLQLRSAPVSPGIIDATGASEQRVYTISYEIGFSFSNTMQVIWTNSATSQEWTVLSLAASSPTGYQTNWFWLADFMGETGTLLVKLIGGGKVYQIADNIARQQLAEPFSLKVGTQIDTTTGSFGLAETDLAIEGGPLPIAFTRYYAAHSDHLGPLGYRWSHTWDTRVVLTPQGDAGVIFGSGREEFFKWQAVTSTYVPADPRVRSTLVRNPGGDFVYKTTDNLTFAFMASGKLWQVSDLNGNHVDLVYDAQDRLEQVEDPGGRTLSLAYDANGRLESLTGPDGAEVTYGYDANGDLTEVTSPGLGARGYSYSRHRLIGATDPADGVLFTNTLDAVNRVIAQEDELDRAIRIDYESPSAGVTEVTNREGGLSVYHYDRFGRSTAQIDGEGNVSVFVYDGQGNLERYVDPYGEDTELAFDSSGNLNEITDPYGNPTELTYNATRLPLSVTDARGNTTTYTYDTQGNVLTVTNPLNETWTYTYDSRGNRLTEESPLGHVWTDTYDAANNRTSREDPLGNVQSWTYDANGWVVTATDANGNVTTYTYDLGGRLTTLEDAVGNEWEYSYNLLGELASETDPTGATTTWFYLGLPNQVTAKLDASDNQWQYEYDAEGRMTKAIDPLGHETVYSYDADGRLIAETIDPNPQGQSSHLAITTSYVYDAAGRLVEEIDPLGRSTTYVYDEGGRLVGKELPNGGVWTYEYDEVGNLTVATDPLSHSTVSAYDAANRLISVTDPLGHVVEYDYDADGRMIAETIDPGTSPHLNLTTTYAYDEANRLISVTDPLNQTTTYEYDPAGNQIAVTNPANETTTYTYDELNRLVEVTDPLLRTTTYEYDPLGRKTAEILPSGRKTIWEYDAVGQLLSIVVDPNPHSQTGHLALTTSYNYDEAGRRISETNPRGLTTSYEYDAANRLIEITDADGGTVLFTLDAAGQTQAVTNPRGQLIDYTYDLLGNLATETDPLGRTQTHEYDLAGREIEFEDARGVVVTYTYDNADQLIEIVYPAVGSQAAGTVTYGYDAANRRTGMTDTAGGAIGWTYDAAGRVTQTTSPEGTIGYTYDAAGRRATLTLPNSRTATYAYDDAGQLTSVTDWQTRTTNYDYDLDGRVEEVLRSNDVRSAYAYDAAGRLIGISHYDPLDQPLAEYGYTLDANGNRLEVAITGSAVITGSETYSYDVLDRLTEATYPGGGSANYDYDANGNRIEVVSGSQTTTYTYDDADQLTHIDGPGGVVQLTYDPNGNRLTDGNGTFVYDWRNRLKSATVGTTTVAYGYSADDLRVSRSENGGPAQTLLWDRQSGLPELVDDGTLSYLHDNAGELATIDGAGDATYPLEDALGTARARTDDTGAVVGTADYDVWGNQRYSSGQQGAHGWVGERTDPATGLTYLRARDYAPGSGRFLQMDPVSPSVGGSQGYNPYPYAANNPANLTDPSGLSPLDWFDDAVEGLKTLVARVREVVAMYSKLPPLVRPLVGALLGFVSFVVRAAVLMIVMVVVEQIAGAVLKLAAAAVKWMLSWTRAALSPAAKMFQVCGVQGRQICLSVPRMLTKVPRKCWRAVGEGVSALGVAAVIGGGITGADLYGFTLEVGLQCASGRDELEDTCANSFDGDTEVMMADGTTKRIEEVKPGDLVLADDPRTGARGYRRVTDLIEGRGEKHLVDVTIETATGRETFTATSEHPIWVASQHRWVYSRNLQIGDLVLESERGVRRIVEVYHYTGNQHVYNLSVDEFDTFFVLAGETGVLVHNAKRCSVQQERFRRSLGCNADRGERAHHIIPIGENNDIAIQLVNYLMGQGFTIEDFWRTDNGVCISRFLNSKVRKSTYYWQVYSEIATVSGKENIRRCIQMIGQALQQYGFFEGRIQRKDICGQLR